MSKSQALFLYATVFVTGTAVLIVEILGTRVLAPFYGSTIFVWSSLISVTLGFLALGYWLGGKLADKKHSFVNFYLLIVLAGILFFGSLQYKRFAILFADNFGLQYGPLVAALLLFGPTFFLLGMVDPYAIRLITRDLTRTGRRSGTIFALSTVGALAGALAAGFFLIPLVSLNAIFLLVALALAGVGIGGMALFRERQGVFPARAVAIVVAALVFAGAGEALKNTEPSEMTLRDNGVYVTETMYEDSTFYGTYRLVGVPRASDGVHCLLIDGANQGCVLPPERSNAYNTGSPYAVVAFFLEQLPPGGEVLVLGAGAGEFFRYWAPDWLQYTIVDINPSAEQVFELAGVELNPERHTLVVDDARSYLNKTNKQYDAIWNDLFGDASPVTHMITQEAFQLAKTRLKPEGMLITNVFGTTTGNDKLVNNVFATLKSVFSYVVAAPKDRDHFFTYIVAVGSEKPLNAERVSAAYHERRNTEDDVWGPQNYYFYAPAEGGGVVLTDAYNPAEYLWSKNVAAQETLASFRMKFKRLSAQDFR